MMGQANIWFRYMPEKYQPAIDRYQNEARRLFGILDRQLDGRAFIVDDLSIADIATWPWIRGHEWSGVSLDPYPALARWRDMVGERPAVQAGMPVPARAPRSEEGDARLKDSVKGILA